MRSFLVSCLAAVVIALSAAIVLTYVVQTSSETAFTSPAGTRVTM